MKMSVSLLPISPNEDSTIGAILMDAGLLSAEDNDRVLAHLGWLFVDVFSHLWLGCPYHLALRRAGSWAIDSGRFGLAFLVDQEAFAGRESST